jgi:hypothetical protein
MIDSCFSEFPYFKRFKSDPIQSHLIFNFGEQSILKKTTLMWEAMVRFTFLTHMNGIRERTA